MKRPHFFDHTPIRDWKIAPEVEHIFIGTIEKQERWQTIKAKNQPIQLTAIPNLKPFKQHLN